MIDTALLTHFAPRALQRTTPEPTGPLHFSCTISSWCNSVTSKDLQFRDLQRLTLHRVALRTTAFPAPDLYIVTNADAE